MFDEVKMVVAIGAVPLEGSEIPMGQWIAYYVTGNFYGVLYRLNKTKVIFISKDIEPYLWSISKFNPASMQSDYKPVKIKLVPKVKESAIEDDIPF